MTEPVASSSDNVSSIRVASFSISRKSLPLTLIANGVLTPVASISMRVRIGCTQALVTPGICTRSSSSAMISSTVMPSRHSLSGFRVMLVSIMVIGAGSVAVSARPTLPKTRSTSGCSAMSLSVCCSNSPALSTLIPGNVVGMYMRSPSCSGGISS